MGCAPVGVMSSPASREAKAAVIAGCDARVGCAAVDALADRLANRLVAALPRTEAYVEVLAASLHPEFRIGA